MTEIISKELMYQPVVNNHSTTVFRKVSPQGTSTSLVQSSSSAYGPVEFIIPPSVFNPSKSRLNFEVSVEEVSTKYTWIDANALTAISRIVLYDSATGNLWCDVSNMDLYAKMTSSVATHYDEFKTKGGAATVAFASGATAAATSRLYVNEDIVKSNSNANYTRTGTNLATNNLYESRQQLFVSAVGGTNAYSHAINFSIPFSAFKFTALSVDRMLYVPSNLILQVYFSPTDNYAWTSDSATAPQTNPVSIVANKLTINNVALQLANEGNLAIVSQVIDRVMKEGISIPIGYPTVTRQSLTTAAPSYQLTLSKAYGSRILAILTAAFTAGSSAVNARSSHTRGNLTYYNTFINNVAIKYPNGFNCLASEDFYYGAQAYLKNSVVQNITDYINAEYVLIDSFFGEKPIHELDVTQIDGLDVGNSTASWSFAGTLSGSETATYATAIVGQKMLSLTNQGSIVS